MADSQEEGSGTKWPNKRHHANQNHGRNRSERQQRLYKMDMVHYHQDKSDIKTSDDRPTLPTQIIEGGVDMQEEGAGTKRPKKRQYSSRNYGWTRSESQLRPHNMAHPREKTTKPEVRSNNEHTIQSIPVIIRQNGHNRYNRTQY